ncbi:hypothetical protein GCM10025857_09340 [Alicyclobacillus contaminans]|uniref:penicillin-binding protein 2 n=1 Tax=Alicyclobacillus contaminans TaxID=392016 RepID=UPI00040F9B7A|nr:penicillin-binding protein 2 [Alicyclobacillus contaminans]GMA49577.1 hypothetical protein GCM10025857_09340 [Alicyclobacillus contaminans]
MKPIDKREVPPKAGRASLLYGMIFVAFSTLIARLGYLQITEGQQFHTQATDYQYVTTPVLPVRGRIYDTNNNLLAYDAPVYNLYFTKSSSTNDQSMNELAQQLSVILKTPAKTLYNTMKNSDFETTLIAKKLTESQMAYIEEHKSDLPGVDIQAASQRVYPFGDLAGQVLGYTGAIQPEDEKKFDAEHIKYLPTETVGRTGLELEYERELQGMYGYELSTVNSADGTVTSLGFNPAPKPGDNLKLTLDGVLQAEAQNDVLSVINSSQYKNAIDDASAVAIDVKTGGVLAMVSYPYLDPNWFADGTSGKHANYLKSTSAQMNHAIQSPMYPGSTVKPANLITALQLGVISPSFAIQDRMITYVAGTPMSDDGMNHGFVDAIKAIGVSCDTYFYEVGLKMGQWFGGVSNYQQWADTSFIKGLTEMYQGEWDFGLGPTTGIDLPGESSGIFWIKDTSQTGAPARHLDLQAALTSLKKTGQYVNHGSPTDLAYAGIGQMQQFTPLQLAQYAATIANNGKRMKPYVVQEIIPQDGGKPTVVHPVVQNVVKANPQYFKMVQQGMYDALYGPGGTAYGVFNNDPYKAAGKTGTAEIYMHGQKVDNSVFIAYAPYDNPQVAVAVMVPGAGYGAQAAAPIAEKMFDTYFKEHHEFFPKDQWLNVQIPASWLSSPAYKDPESKN